jgi:ubiquinone/menaquinone biosynthesis C-methylase UbiE
MTRPAQSLAVQRAQVEFHNFASLGEPGRALAHYEEENRRRARILERHRDFIGPITPFLEIGANAGHTSYLLANEFGGAGFALDISADALRHGIALMDRWSLVRAPVRIAGDALHLPFRDGSIRFVLACQMLSQFMDIESVFVEVKRVLAPGGVFAFMEEPLRRALSLRLYRAPYQDRMKPWERKLFDWGLLGYVAHDVIGAEQEESFGIRQNHQMYLGDWRRLMARHFAEHRCEVVVPERGWGERAVKRAIGSDWRAARLLGGVLAGLCRKAGDAAAHTEMPRFETLLRCPECQSDLTMSADASLSCACGYSAPDEGGVYNLLPAALRAKLYPGDRDDAIDFSLPGHAARLGEGWYELEGDFGNKYRWIGTRATAVLRPVRPGPQRLRVRGFAHPGQFERGQPEVGIAVDGSRVAHQRLERIGLFVIEADLPEREEYSIEITAAPEWTIPEDDRTFTVNISMVRLIEPE